VTPDEAAAWLPLVRDVLALLSGIALGAYGLVHHDPWVAVPGFALAGLAIDVQAGLLARLVRAAVARLRR
jgi:hypothetical protein